MQSEYRSVIHGLLILGTLLMDCIVWKGISEDDTEEMKKRVKRILKTYLHFKYEVFVGFNCPLD